MKNEKWEELYEYIKNNILKYPKEMKLPKFLIMRLRGLNKGVFISNKYIESMGEYSYELILLTFKICKPKIDNALYNRSKFKNEQHMVNTIMLIVEKNINDVFIRMKRIEKAEEKKDNIVIAQNSNAEYVKKTKKNKLEEKLKDIF